MRRSGSLFSDTYKHRAKSLDFLSPAGEKLHEADPSCPGIVRDAKYAFWKSRITSSNGASKSAVQGSAVGSLCQENYGT
jgi:hypothetical protein